MFEKMMNYLYNNGFKTISTEEFYKWYKGKIEFYGKTVMITIDDGKYEDYYLAYPIIKKYNFKAASFIVGSRIHNKTKKYNKNESNYIGLDIVNRIRKE
jgi:peptidoglycan/xylan/chitin deacetylase (PgdA/CDA1 family)